MSIYKVQLTGEFTLHCLRIIQLLLRLTWFAIFLPRLFWMFFAW